MKRTIYLIIVCLILVFSIAKADNFDNMGYTWEDGQWRGEFPSLKRAIEGAVMLYVPCNAWVYGGYNWIYVKYNEVEIADTIKIKNAMYSYRHRAIYGANYVVSKDEDNKDFMRYSEEISAGTFDIEFRYTDDKYTILNFKLIQEGCVEINDNEYIWEDEDRMARKWERGPYIKGFEFNAAQEEYENNYKDGEEYPYFYNYIGMYIVDGKIFVVKQVDDRPSFIISVSDGANFNYIEDWLIEPKDGIIKKTRITK